MHHLYHDVSKVRYKRFRFFGGNGLAERMHVGRDLFHSLLCNAPYKCRRKVFVRRARALYILAGKVWSWSICFQRFFVFVCAFVDAPGIRVGEPCLSRCSCRQQQKRLRTWYLVLVLVATWYVHYSSTVSTSVVLCCAVLCCAVSFLASSRAGRAESRLSTQVRSTPMTQQQKYVELMMLCYPLSIPWLPWSCSCIYLSSIQVY
jgi:hypothetical protein